MGYALIKNCLDCHDHVYCSEYTLVKVILGIRFCQNKIIGCVYNISEGFFSFYFLKLHLKYHLYRTLTINVCGIQSHCSTTTLSKNAGAGPA